MLSDQLSLFGLFFSIGVVMIITAASHRNSLFEFKLFIGRTCIRYICDIYDRWQ